VTDRIGPAVADLLTNYDDAVAAADLGHADGTAVAEAH